MRLPSIVAISTMALPARTSALTYLLIVRYPPSEAGVSVSRRDPSRLAQIRFGELANPGYGCILGFCCYPFIALPPLSMLASETGTNVPVTTDQVILPIQSTLAPLGPLAYTFQIAAQCQDWSGRQHPHLTSLAWSVTTRFLLAPTADKKKSPSSWDPNTMALA